MWGFTGFLEWVFELGGGSGGNEAEPKTLKTVLAAVLGFPLDEEPQTPQPHKAGSSFVRETGDLVQDAVLVIASDGLWDVMCGTQDISGHCSESRFFRDFISRC